LFSIMAFRSSTSLSLCSSTSEILYSQTISQILPKSTILAQVKTAATFS
jgi:hypothetical protein